MSHFTSCPNFSSQCLNVLTEMILVCSVWFVLVWCYELWIVTLLYELLTTSSERLNSL